MSHCAGAALEISSESEGSLEDEVPEEELDEPAGARKRKAAPKKPVSKPAAKKPASKPAAKKPRQVALVLLGDCAATQHRFQGNCQGPLWCQG